MKKNENNSNKKSLKLFGLITAAILVAALLWFIILPIIFNAGSSFLKDILSKKEEVKFEAFSPEAFAYDVGESWEINATVNARGFTKHKQNDEFTASFSYSIDLVNPEGETENNIYSDSLKITDRELNYVQLEAQFELSESYAQGTYKIIFNVVDNYSGRNTAAQAEFELEE